MFVFPYSKSLAIAGRLSNNGKSQLTWLQMWDWAYNE